MDKYNPKKVERKWQKYWEKEGIYKNYGKKKKFYALDMFPYPSGDGLHIGHPKGYTATDVFSRMKMLQGFSVLHPMGWDAFGLPAENYAIKNKIHPELAVKKNIKRFKEQLGKFGFTYDWDREINTTDPEYYKWTQWIFLQMFKKGLAYQSEEPINWCPKCKTGLALEDLDKGLCEACGTQIVKKKVRQWVLKMTAYADRLLEDLKLLDWEDSIIEQQRNWIGKSVGAEFEMKIKDTDEKIEVYTTRLDTVFGMTYAVVAPEHPIVASLLKIKNKKSKIKNIEEIKKYIIKSQNKTDLERTELQKEKTGVEIKGIKVINPFTNEEIPVFVADYVLGHYGTGAVMAVPAHDERDFEFAKKYNLPIKGVVFPEKISSGLLVDSVDKKSGEFKKESDRKILSIWKGEEFFTEDGILWDNSKVYAGLTSEEAREKMIEWLEKQKIGKKKVNYKMRDWVFSRQRYWGEPIPVVHCEKCGTVPVPEKDLPVKLPKVKSYEPTGTGESPLAKISSWVNVKCPKCKGPAKRETNTMPQWAGSCWYYLAYIMRGISNFQFPISKYGKEFSKWMPVDLYVGGAEHATRHLLYARFWHKFLYDIKAVSTKEPFKRLYHVGLIQAEDGRKMSKRWGNVINPDDMIKEFGADAVRLYEMFMGPFDQSIAWSTEGVMGTRRFLEKVYKLNFKVQISNSKPNPKLKIQNNKLEILLNKTIKKVTEDIENFRFNTAISTMMILANEMEKQEEIAKSQFSNLLLILSPFAPHICEELWSKLGNKKSIFLESWPKFNPKLIKDDEIELVIQVNGKLRDRIRVPAEISEDEAKDLAMKSENAKKFTSGKEIRKIVFVPGKLLNIVV